MAVESGVAGVSPLRGPPGVAGAVVEGSGGGEGGAEGDEKKVQKRRGGGTGVDAGEEVAGIGETGAPGRGDAGWSWVTPAGAAGHGCTAAPRAFRKC